MLQKEVIRPGKRYETSTWDPSRHLTARIDRGHEIVAYMHDERWNLHLREQFAHIEISHDFKVPNQANVHSDWDVDELSLEAWVSDLETVVDTLGIERFPLLGVSQGCAISIAYAARHPERLSHLILYGGFALGGGKRSPAEHEKSADGRTL